MFVNLEWKIILKFIMKFKNIKIIMKFRYYFTCCDCIYFNILYSWNFQNKIETHFIEFIEISYLDIVDIESYVIFYITLYFYNIVIIKIFTYKWYRLYYTLLCK